MASQNLSGRAAAKARRQLQVSGKSSSAQSTSRTRATRAAVSPGTATSSRAAPRAVSSASARQASLDRRKSMSSRGKAGLAATDPSRSADSLRSNQSRAKAKSDDCGCGCNGQGDCNDGKLASVDNAHLSAPNETTKYIARRRDNKVFSKGNSGRVNARARRQILAKQGKNGENALKKGLSSAQLVRQNNPNINGRDLARGVREMRSTQGARGSKTASAPLGRTRPSRSNEEVTGTMVAHSKKTTGDTVGLCRSITGTHYLSGEVFSDFCQGDVPKSPLKVEQSQTARGVSITTGGRVGGSINVTGNERGSCRSVTGNEYLGNEHFAQLCKTKATPSAAKVSFAQTSRGTIVSGSKPARSSRVIGNEPGTCKAVTGTPYAGMDQYEQYCDSKELGLAKARTQPIHQNAGKGISGIQPGLSKLTGAEKGSCERVSGTPYLSSAQQAEVCGVTPAQTSDSDFPQSIDGAPWGAFSVDAPGHASAVKVARSAVTGSRYEQGKISGTFSLGEGKITGTEEFRFDHKSTPNEIVAQTPPREKQVGRITGEGIDTGLKITGDDWDRGDRVTGTEGMSAVKRNLTRRGPVNAMPGVHNKRNEAIDVVESKVTGGSGNTEKGAHITVSGGARG